MTRRSWARETLCGGRILTYLQNWYEKLANMATVRVYGIIPDKFKILTEIMQRDHRMLPHDCYTYSCCQPHCIG